MRALGTTTSARLGAAALTVALAAALSAALAVPVLAAGTWSAGGSLNLGRTAFPATVLEDGSVLVAGGAPGGTVGATAERYDPITDTWTLTGNLAVARTGPALAALDDGGALVAGGAGASGLLRSAERLDAATDEWTAAPPMATGRMNHTATSLADGRVLVVGGVTDNGGATNEVEIYDPVTDAWTRADSLHNPRYNHTATLLLDGRVLIVGGFTPGSFHTATKKVEIYDPVTDRWAVVGSMSERRAVHAATRLDDGRVLVAGGVTSPPNVLTVTASVEIFDPATAAWSAAPSMAAARRAVDAVTLPDGTVLVAGGFLASGNLTATAERFDVLDGAWSAEPGLSSARAPHLTELFDGRVLAIASIGRVTTTVVDVYQP